MLSVGLYTDTIVFEDGKDSIWPLKYSSLRAIGQTDWQGYNILCIKGPGGLLIEVSSL